jgi:hypothetical protein
LTTEGEVPSEFSKIKACYSFVAVIGSLVLDYINKDLNKLEVILLMEVEEVLLPELVCMNWAPSKMMLLSNLFLEFINR